MEDEDFFEEPESINRLGCQSDMVAVEELDPGTISDSDQVLGVHEVFANDKEPEDSSNITPESVQFEIDWTTPVCPPPPPFYSTDFLPNRGASHWTVPSFTIFSNGTSPCALCRRATPVLLSVLMVDAITQWRPLMSTVSPAEMDASTASLSMVLQHHSKVFSVTPQFHKRPEPMNALF
jgi:hypothetical protein